MPLEESGLTYKKTDEMLVASINFKGEYKDVAPQFEKLYQVSKDYICGPAIALYDYGVYTEGVDIEVCFPVTQPVETGEIKSRTLESAEVLSLIHQGPYENLQESYQKLYRYFGENGVAATALCREVYVESDPANPEMNVTELQAVLHRWDDRLAVNVEKVLGEHGKEKIMQDRQLFTLESSIDERAMWIKAAMERLDQLASEDEKYDILSRCAHEFSQKRIATLKAIYEQTKDVDSVLQEMRKDPPWYEDPVREGNIIYVEKVPYNKEGYEKADSDDDKKMNYCHCPLVRKYLNEGISPTFCYCGSGWYRQLWEGIVGKSVKVDIVRSLLKGDNTCEFAIYLPFDV